jgi:hypothetical protein
MRKTISLLVLAVAILVLSVILAKDYLPLPGSWSRIGGGGEKAPQERKSTHPRVDAHRLLEQKTPAAIIYEWLPYYYRHPGTHEIVEVIEVLLAQDNDIPGGLGVQRSSTSTRRNWKRSRQPPNGTRGINRKHFAPLFRRRRTIRQSKKSPLRTSSCCGRNTGPQGKRPLSRA